MSSPDEKLVAFLPWLKLSSSVSVGKVSYVPFETGETDQDEPLKGLANSLTKILSSYVSFLDRSVAACTVVLKADRNPLWNLEKGDFEEVQWATSLLFLAASAHNDYFQQLLPNYVNRAMFDLYWQRFTEPVDFVSLTARRRDGELLIGGYRHGQVKFTVPIQAESSRLVSPDTGLLRAVEVAQVGSSDVTRRLRAALSFFSLANTDSDVMLPEAEIILMASAFEHLLEGYGARPLSKKFSDLFHSFGSVTVTQALPTRNGMVVDPEYAHAQESWFIHRKWIEELYQLRNAYAHGESSSSRTWGWLRSEHLAIAAFAFPLAVKLTLKREGHYTLTKEDEVRCHALDLLLAKTDWREFQKSNLTVWQEQLGEARRKVSVQRAVAACEALLKTNEPQGESH